MKKAVNCGCLFYGGCISPAIITAYRNYSWLTVCLDNGHGEDTLGKCSPYVSTKTPPALYFREYAWSREIVAMLKAELEKYGVDVYVVVPEENDIKLSTRANRANAYKAANKAQKCVFLSIHANAAGSDGKWHDARGWCAFTTKGVTNSDDFAKCLYDAAEEILPPDQKIRKYTQNEPDWEENFTVIYKANMPAVLTENFFQDNVKDVEYILSDEGKKAVVDLHVKGILDFADKMWKNKK